MTFTDDDLKRLKERLDAVPRVPDHVAAIECGVNGLKALLARLEAAEKALYWSASMAEEGFYKKDVVQMLKDFVVDLDAWRKACGR